MIELRSGDHTCNCGACIEIPRFHAEGSNLVALRDHHTCGCEACIAALTSLVDTGSLRLSNLRHSCDCPACEAEQQALFHESVASSTDALGRL